MSSLILQLGKAGLGQDFFILSSASIFSIYSQALSNFLLCPLLGGHKHPQLASSFMHLHIDKTALLNTSNLVPSSLTITPETLIPSCLTYIARLLTLIV